MAATPIWSALFGVLRHSENGMDLPPRFAYGNTLPWIEFAAAPDGGFAGSSRLGQTSRLLRTYCPYQGRHLERLREVHSESWETRTFALTYGCSYEEIPQPIDANRELQDTDGFWREWSGRSKYQGPYTEAVERSLITLKAMTYRPSGGIVAAPTTSLSERLGGPLNWDYRYCWIRDATFTISALLGAGYTEEVIAWKAWLIRAVGRDGSQIQIMYGICGERYIADWEVPWLTGYEGSTPIRIGNAAQKQTQQDIYGEVASAFFRAREAGVASQREELQLQQAITEYLAKVWEQPGSGMWEERDKPHRFTYSASGSGGA